VLIRWISPCSLIDGAAVSQEQASGSPPDVAERQGGQGCTISKVTTANQVRELALKLPETVEKPEWGRPCFRVDDKIFASLRDGDEELSVKVSAKTRAALVEADPQTFSVPAHYVRSPMFVVRLASVSEEQMRELLTDAWRMTAPRRLLDELDSRD